MKPEKNKAREKEMKALSKVILFLNFQTTYIKNQYNDTTIGYIESFDYNDKVYSGTAICAQSDMEFFSKKVGTHIAREKAIIELLKDIAIDKEIPVIRENNLKAYIDSQTKFIENVKRQRKREKLGLDPLPPKFIDLDKRI